MNILDEIFEHKALEVADQKRACPPEEVRRLAEKAPPALDFIGTIRRGPGQRPALIAEVKKASPSRGLLAADFDPLRLAGLYRDNGASAISVLTETRYFLGSLDILRQIAAAVPRLPLLRKDFIFDPYQVFEARAAGADAILLIAAHLKLESLASLHALANDLGMAALVEVHSQAELEMALAACRPALLGINNRDLVDFTVDLETTARLRPLAPSSACVVAESGIHAPADVDRLAACGIDAILVGEALVTAPDPAAKIRSLSR